MGCGAWRRVAPAGFEHDPRSAVFPELRANLVRLHAPRGRPHQNPVLGSLSGTNPGSGTSIQLKVRELKDQQANFYCVLMK